MADVCGIYRSARRHESYPRPKLGGTGNSYRLSPRRRAGLLLAGICFILPAAFIVTAIAWAYVRLGKLPEASALLYGVKPVIIAVVLQALWNLGKTAVKTKLLAAAGIIAVACLAGMNELIVLFGVGLVLVAIRGGEKSSPRPPEVSFLCSQIFRGLLRESLPQRASLWPRPSN